MNMGVFYYNDFIYGSICNLGGFDGKIGIGFKIVYNEVI